MADRLWRTTSHQQRALFSIYDGRLCWWKKTQFQRKLAPNLATVSDLDFRNRKAAARIYNFLANGSHYKTRCVSHSVYEMYCVFFRFRRSSSIVINRVEFSSSCLLQCKSVSWSFELKRCLSSVSNYSNSCLRLNRPSTSQRSSVLNGHSGIRG